MDTDYVSVTEMTGDEVSQEQVDRLCKRYYWASQYCKDKDVVEAACGTGHGIGYLQSVARSFEAGDYSEKILNIARRHYGDRIALQQFDAQNLPFNDKSKDTIILFEAIYYLPDAERFVKECVRVLRPGGKVLIATANKDLYDFNPSPHSYKYYGVLELNELFARHGFKTEFFGDTCVDKVSLRQKLLRPIKKFVVMSGLMPKSMAGKKFLKRIVFGDLIIMPAEIGPPSIPAPSAGTLGQGRSNKDFRKEQNVEGLYRTHYIKPDRIASDVANKMYKVIYCEATLE